MGGGKSGSSTTTANIPSELKPLFTQTGQQVQQAQLDAPISDFLAPTPTGIAPLSGTTERAIEGIPGIGATPGAETEARTAIGNLPGIAGQTPETGTLTGLAGQDISNQRLSELSGQDISTERLRGLAGEEQSAEALRAAGDVTSATGGIPSSERLRRLSGQGVSAEALRNSPFLAAANDFFRSEIQPGVENRATLSGLGRSTAVENAIAKTQAANALPALRAAAAGEEARIGREIGAERTGIGLAERGIQRGQTAEEARIGRGVGAEETALGLGRDRIGRGIAAERTSLGLEEGRIGREIAAERTGQGLAGERIGRQIGAEQAGIGVRERGIGREAAAVESGIQNLRGLGQAETGRRLSEFEAGLRGGDIERSVEQERFNAEQADRLRRQGISEQALFGPLGQLPSTFGQSTRTQTGK